MPASDPKIKIAPTSKITRIAKSTTFRLDARVAVPRVGTLGDGSTEVPTLRLVA